MKRLIVASALTIGLGLGASATYTKIDSNKNTPVRDDHPVEVNKFTHPDKDVANQMQNCVNWLAQFEIECRLEDTD